MNKKQIRLTESDLKQIVKESVNRIVKESDELDANGLKGYLAKRKLTKNESKNMNKKLFKLTESDLHRIVKRAVNETLANQQSVPNDMAGEFLTDEQFYENNWYDFKVCVDAMVSKIEKLESAKQNNISIRHYADGIQKCLYKLNKMWPSIKSMYLNLKYPDYPIDDLKYSRKVDAMLGYDK